MNMEPLWRVPQTKLAKLPDVVMRLVKRDMPWFTDAISPRRLLFGLYVHYQNARKKIRDLEAIIYSQAKYIGELKKENADLEDYRKQVVFEGYYAIITRFHWTCGDGCCSDSWHGFRVFNKDRVCEYEKDMSTSNTYRSESGCRDEIKERFGSIPVYEETEDV